MWFEPRTWRNLAIPMTFVTVKFGFFSLSRAKDVLAWSEFPGRSANSTREYVSFRSVSDDLAIISDPAVVISIFLGLPQNVVPFWFFFCFLDCNSHRWIRKTSTCFDGANYPPKKPRQKRWKWELTLKCKLKCYVKPMKYPLGVSPSKGQGTTQSKEKILLTPVGIEPTTSRLDVPLLLEGLLPILAYTGRLRPKGVPFPGFRYVRVRISQVEVYKGVGKSVI